MSQTGKKPNPLQQCQAAHTGDLDARREIPRLTEAIVHSFADGDHMAHLDQSPMPDEPSVVRVLSELESLLFPGYHGRNQIERHNLIFFVGEVAIRVYEDLSVQISRALRNDCRGKPAMDQCVDCDQHGRGVAVLFLERLPGLRRILATDVQAAFDGDPAAKSKDEIIFCYPGLRAVTIYRVAHLLHELNVPIIPRMMTEYAHRETGIDIHPGAKIGSGFFIDHGTGVVIGETTVIGKNVQIYQGVTLGAMRLPRDENGKVMRDVKRHPTIEDDVTIYAQATILGGDTIIGQGAVVGGNTWITHSGTALCDGAKRAGQGPPAPELGACRICGLQHLTVKKPAVIAAVLIPLAAALVFFGRHPDFPPNELTSLAAETSRLHRYAESPKPDIALMDKTYREGPGGWCVGWIRPSMSKWTTK
ncbi:MAG: serine acetyltransferase [Deltaproteobacteria bacterium]|nr:serine acetyltransferase [Deltaproteobacteria bacterium]